METASFQTEIPLVETNQELIEYLQALIAYSAYDLIEACIKTEPQPPTFAGLCPLDNCVSPQPLPEDVKSEIKQYKPRLHVKATEHERQVSRNYYIAHRELILEKRRIYNARLKGRRISKA
jgi:hypothetical protein